ncbi:MAG: ATP-binding protein, partial [Aureliella sp.]
VLITEEVLAADEASCLVEVLAEQPSWSDLPILLLCGSGADSSVAVSAMNLLGNVTVLERPVRLTTLISSLRAALRARRRQYQLRSQLDTLHTQSERLRLLWDTAAVMLTNEQPATMMRNLFTRIANHFDLDAYFNYIVDEAAGVLQLESFTGIPADVAASLSRLEFGQAICGTVALTHKPFLVTHVQQSDDPICQLIKSFGIRVYFCNPLIAGDRVLGTLSFASRRRDTFEDDELEFLQTACRYVAYTYERLRLIRRLRKEDEKKDEFLATLAHELRNPLAPIRNAAHYLRMRGPSDPELRTARDIIDRQVQLMSRLVDDLLDISRITRGKIVLQKETANIAQIVSNAVESSRPPIDEARHELRIELPGDPLRVHGDVARLAQIVSNLLTNAAKYTNPGGVIRLSAEQQGDQVVISVRDTGIGISSENLSRIFEMFSQVDPALERTQGGLGIGLALVKRLVGMHQGEIEARSEGLGKGSEFIVRLPLLVEAIPPATEEPNEPKPQVAQANKCRIVVADDNVDAAKSLTMLLSFKGHDVRTAYDGLAAVELAENFRPDLMLVDIGMPKMNGYDAARTIRGKTWGSSTVLVALTGWGQEDDKRRAAEAGFDHHFTKPVDLGALESLLIGRDGA